MTDQNQQLPLQLRQQLTLYTDQFIKLSDNPIWQEFAERYPDLEELRQDAIESADNLWWRFRTKCCDF